MYRHLLMLSNGTELFSGAEQEHALQAVTVTQTVNTGEELTLGSVCTCEFQADVITSGGLSLAAGDAVTLFRVDEDGNRQQMGIFYLEKPQYPTAYTMSLTAYDGINLLDKDLTQWLEGLDQWPYSLLTFADMVCEACGLTLVNDSIPNGDYMVQKFAAQGVTGRKLMQWVGEIAGRFCRATPSGEIEFAWYEPSGVSITPDGDCFFYQNSLTYEDYSVAPIEKVQIRLTQDDMGVVWPDETGEKNTYIISGNYLLTTTSSEAILPLAQTLYEQLKDVTYTPCKVVLPASPDIHAGHTVQITDRNGKTFTSYVMTKTQNGQRDTLECTGSHRRDSTTAVNNEGYRALNRKMLEIKKDVEGLSVVAGDLEEEAQTIRENVADLAVEAVGIRTEVYNTQKEVDSITGQIAQADTRLTSLEQTSQQVQINVQSIVENGVDRVTTKTGYTFNEVGMEVDRTDSATKTVITSDGMDVYSKTGGETKVLSATSEGVEAKDLHAKTYLIVSGKCRFEKYGNDRVGCYWIGGE